MSDTVRDGRRAGDEPPASRGPLGVVARAGVAVAAVSVAAVAMEAVPAIPVSAVSEGWNPDGDWHRLDERVAATGQHDAVARAFALGHAAVDTHLDHLGAGDPQLRHALLEQQSNLITARRLAELMDAQLTGPTVAGGIAQAVVATDWQARRLGVVVDPSSPAGHESPSAAITSFLDRFDAVPDPEQHAAIEGLDDLPAEVAAALAAVVDAFDLLDRATQHSYEHFDAGRLHAREQELRDLANLEPDELSRELESGEVSIPAVSELLAEVGVDLAPVLSARLVMLDAVEAFAAAMDDAAAAQTSAAAPIAFYPWIVVDLDLTATTYSRDVMLLVDAAGDDTYHNNAGGSVVVSGTQDRCTLPGLGGSPHRTGALIDLLGNDRYISGERCGVNGGGYVGTGMLVDTLGTDTYTAGGQGTNGGAQLAGTGFLLDTPLGGDSFSAGGGGSNGGGDLGGVGFLGSGALGADSYMATQPFGTNGGAFAGLGFLADGGGLGNVYQGGDEGSNGGAMIGGAGFLLDGPDVSATGTPGESFLAGSHGANGGGELGVGFLFSADTNTTTDTYSAGTRGTNGGGDAGAGLLVDAGGADRYTAKSFGTNGGGAAGVGTLIDVDGNDRYEAGDRGANGAGDTGGGLLYDAGGNDSYLDSEGGTGTNKTVVPKGLVGAQIDGNPLPPQVSTTVPPLPPLPATAAEIEFSVEGTLPTFPCPEGCEVAFGGSGTAAGSAREQVGGTVYTAGFTVVSGSVTGSATYTEPGPPLCPASGSAVGTAKLSGNAVGAVHRSTTPTVTGNMTGVTFDIQFSYQRVGTAAVIEITGGSATVAFTFPDTGAGAFSTPVDGGGGGVFLVDALDAGSRCGDPGSLPFEIVGDVVVARS